MKYNAFISYRHAPLDMEIAKKVHTGLETYKIPGSVKKRLGIKRINRVFRDQEELPIGSNLSDNINEALENSEFLIVICSPRTPESAWVAKEIETFISLHGRENILAVLVEGEPDESFPPLLLTDENGNPVEPLAADVRGETAKERNKKFKTEILRLVAPVIGCTYDDLRQRHRERIVRRTVSLVSAAAAIVAIAGTAFGLYKADVATQMTTLATEKATLADEKTQLADEILAEYLLKQENQSRFYAKEAISLLKEGEREDAALVAIEALPGEGNERPFVAEAEYALSNVLHAYDIGEDMSFDRTLPHDLSMYEEKLSSDGKHLITRDSGNNVYIWDAESWQLVNKIPARVDKDSYLVSIDDIYADSNSVYIVSSHLFDKYSFEGARIFSYESESIIDGSAVSADRNTGYIMIDNAITSINLSKGTEISTIELPVEGNVYSDAQISSDGAYLLFPFQKKDTGRIDMAAYNIDKNVFKITRLSNDYVMDYCYTALGNLAVVSCNPDFWATGIDKIYLDLINPQTGSILWSREIPCSIRSVATFDLMIKAHSYETKSGDSFSEIVVAVEAEAFTYNELTSKLVASVDLPGDSATLNLRGSNAIGFICDDNGHIYTINFHEGNIYKDNTIDTRLPLRQIIIMDGVIALRSAYSSNIHIMKYHTASDLTEIADYVDYYPSIVTAPLGADWFVTRRDSDDTYLVISKDGKILNNVKLNSSYSILTGFCGNKVLLFSYDTMYTADPSAGYLEETPYADMGISNKSYHYGYITDNGKYAVLWSGRSFAVIDIVSKKLILESEGSTSILEAVISEDGTSLYISSREYNLVKIDTSTKEEFEYDESLREYSGLINVHFLAVSHDGSMLAMACMDGNLRIINTSDGTFIDTLPFYAKSRCAIYFTPDDVNLIYQGDSMNVTIRNIREKTYTNSFTPNYELKRPTFTDDGFMTVCDSTYLYFLDTETYGVRAAVCKGAAYIPSEKSFIIGSAGKLYKTRYKDYKALIEEAGRQFPGAYLTEEEKVKYNIN